jgi:hypothetical protein
VSASGTVKVERSKAKGWSYGFEGGSISANIADLVKLEAKEISYENGKNELAFASATVTPHLTTSTIEGLSGSVTKGCISGEGFDWDTLTLKAGQVKLLDGKVTGSKLQGTLKGKTGDYDFDASGTLGVNLASEGIAEVTASGKVTVKRSKAEGWTYGVDKGNISANIADLVKLEATEISYDSTKQVLGIKKSTLSSTALNNTQATLTEGKVSKDGLDWKELAVTTDPINLGGILTLKDIQGKVEVKAGKYAFAASAGLGLNLRDGDIGSLTAEGKASLGYANKALTYGFEGVSVTAEIPKVVTLTAADIDYDQNAKALKVKEASATLAIPKLKGTAVKATGVEITATGTADWDQIEVTGPDIPFGDIFKVTAPKVMVAGAKEKYSAYLEGGATLKFGEYLEGGGEGGIKLDRTDEKNPLKIEKASLAAQGKKTLPGEFMKWPEISFKYPLLPPAIEAGLELIIDGGVTVDLSGKIGKVATQPAWNFAVSPQITGFLTVGLAITAGLGSSYLVGLEAYVQGTCTGQANGGFEFKGQLTYDGGKVKAEKLTSGFNISAAVKAAVVAGVKAKAFYFFTKKLYSYELGAWNLGQGSISGKISIDEEGKPSLSEITKGGLLAGPKAAIEEIMNKGGGPKFSLIASDNKAEELLLNAAEELPGVGEERRERIKEIKESYKTVIKDAEDMIKEETEKAEEYKIKLTNLGKKISKYEELLKKMDAIHGEILSEKAKLNKKEIGYKNSSSQAHQPEKQKKINDSTKKNSKNKTEEVHQRKSSLSDKKSEGNILMRVFKKGVEGVQKLDQTLSDVQDVLFSGADKMLGKFIEKAVQKSDKLARAAVAYTKFTGFNIENVKVGQEKKISKTEDSRAKKEGKLKLHEGKLESAKLTKEKADKILKDVEAAIAMKKEELESGKPMKVKKDVDESTESIRQSTQELESLKMSEELDGLISDIDSLTQGIDAMEEDLQPIPG